MKTYELIPAITLSLIGLAAIILFVYFEWRARNELKELHKLQQRNEELPMFRMYVLTMFGIEAYNRLPCYDYMLHDDKEITFENYVNVDEFINLN